MLRIIHCIILFGIITSCKNPAESNLSENNKESLFCSDNCKAKSKSGELTCKLTTPELQKRKATVIASLKSQVIEKVELKNGYAFKFRGSDQMIDELTAFIKTERECCDFFIFNLSISGDKSEVWLELTGAEEVKTFIETELGFI